MIRTIETERVQLLPIQLNDIKLIHQIFSEPNVARYNSIGIPKSIEETESIIKPIIESTIEPDPNHLVWIARLKRDNAFIGDVGLKLKAKRYQSAEIYFSFLPDYWNLGYCTEIAKAIIRYAFEDLNLHRIEAGCAVDNIGSIRVLEKIGMRREGHSRKILPLKSGWSDNYECAVLKEGLY